MSANVVGALSSFNAMASADRGAVRAAIVATKWCTRVASLGGGGFGEDQPTSDSVQDSEQQARNLLSLKSQRSVFAESQWLEGVDIPPSSHAH